jgi:hypothetical protein
VEVYDIFDPTEIVKKKPDFNVQFLEPSTWISSTNNPENDIQFQFVFDAIMN